MIHIAICDDDRTMAENLNSRLMALRPAYGQEFHVSVFFSGESFCEHLQNTGAAFDIVLMDIEMNAITGVDAGRKLRENIANAQTLLIFISSHKNYHHDLIDLHVFGFIHKPVSHDEFNRKLDKAIKSVIHQQSHLPPELAINIGRSIVNIPADSIMYLESNLRQIHLHTVTTTHTYYGKLDEEKDKLPENAFSRVHKSYIINFAYVKRIAAKSISMTDDRTIPISEQSREKVKAEYIRYRGNENGHY